MTGKNFGKSQSTMTTTFLCYVERVKNKNMLVVLRKGDDVSLGRNLQPTATTDLHVRTFKLSDQMAVSLEHGHVEPVAMAVADQNVTGVAYVNSVRIVGDVLAPDAVKKLTFFVENDDTVTLKWPQTTMSS